MTPDAWITTVVVLGVLVALAREMAPPPYVILTAVVALLLLDVITAEQALSGFANPAPVTVAALYIVAKAVQRTGGVTRGVDLILGKPVGEAGPPSVRSALIRLLPPVMATSALMNNTPIVAVLAPNVATWAEDRGLSSSKLLMPLSFAAILGGVLTAIGTSTTLVVSGLLEQAGERPIGLLEPFPLAVPVAVVGGLVIVALGPRLLPARNAAHQAFQVGAKEFSLTVRVSDDGPLSGVSLTQGGLRALRGVYCVQVRRGSRVVAPVAPDFELDSGDELTFVGDVHRVVDLQHRRGLESTEAHHAEQLGGAAQQFYEAVVGPNSPLLGTTLKQVGFRARFDAAVVAIHRSGEPIEDKLGEVRLRVGDTLLCLASSGFPERTQEGGDFVLVAKIGAEAPLNRRSTRLVLAILAGMLLAVLTGVLSILEASLAAAIALVATKVMSPSQARLAVDTPVIVVIAGAFGLGAAVSSSGLAEVIASAIRVASEPFGHAGLVVGLLLLVMVLTELITNNAAAVLAFPIAQAAAVGAGLAPRPLLIATAIAASLSFVTPLGYQTNLMVYGLGGYRFGDFSRLGSPVSLLTLVSLSLAVLAVI